MKLNLRLVSFLLVTLAAACGAGAQPATLPAGLDAPETQPAPSPTPIEGPLILKLMAYNVLWGGGLDRRFEQFYIPSQHAPYDGRNRFPDIMAVIRRAEPDILAVEEAAGWDEGRPPVAEQVAAELGMRYVIAKNPYGLNVVLFSKLPIVDMVDLVPLMGTNAALVATLQAPSGPLLFVAAAHLDPSSSRMRGCQIDLIFATLAPVEGQRIVLMGDMNFRPTSATMRLLLDRGWQTAGLEPTWGVDQVWLGPWQGWTSEPIWEPGTIAPNLSDHYPVGTEINFGADKPVRSEARPAAPPASAACQP